MARSLGSCGLGGSATCGMEPWGLQLLGWGPWRGWGGRACRGSRARLWKVLGLELTAAAASGERASGPGLR